MPKKVKCKDDEEIAFPLSFEDSDKLIELTDSDTLTGAIEKAIRFTLLHDATSIQEALE